MVPSARLYHFCSFTLLCGFFACGSDPGIEDGASAADAKDEFDEDEDNDAGDGKNEDTDEDSPQKGEDDIEVDFEAPEGMGGQSLGSNEESGDDPEVCDGIDNDGDGQIDNVDEGGDGICDCLNIGTIGRIGPWSNGGDIFKDWLDARSPIPAFEIGDQELTEELLAGLNVIVILRADTAELAEDGSPAHHEFSKSEVAAIQAWVRAGGGLMTTIGYQGNESSEVENVNRLLEPFDLGYDPERTELDQEYLDDWSPDHPISNGISRIRIQNGVEPRSNDGTIVARGDEGRIGIVADNPGDGHVIVYGDEWITYDSEWADVEEQQVELLWLNMIKWMSPPKSCQVAIPPELLVR